MKNAMNAAEARWRALQARGGATLEEIAAIDADTPWAPVEPDWWLEMEKERHRLVQISTQSGYGAGTRA